MGPDLELKEKSEAATEVLVSKENISGSPFSEQKALQPGTNYKGNTCDKETSPLQQTPLCNGNEDVEVNIIGGTSSGKALAVEATAEDVTECSSSFGDTISDTKNSSAFSDPEVESRMYASNASPSMCDDWCEPFQIRKKKLTLHWRRFIRPLMWRCKWIELQLKQLQSQALKYSKELAAYDCRKQQEFASLTLDGFDAKSLPLSGEVRRNKVMKRKKRRRAEEKFDIASYMSNHSVFSYYENKDRADGAFLEAVCGVAVGNPDNNEESKLNDMLSSHDFEDNDKSLEEMIRKIEAAYLQVHKLKARIEKVISDNPGKFCSINRLSILGPSDGLNHYDLNPASPVGSKNTIPLGSVHNSSQLKSEFNKEDQLKLESAGPSHQEITPLLIERMERFECEAQWEDTEDGVLIHNRAAKEELHDFENVRNQLVDKSEESVEVKKTISLAQVPEPDVATVSAEPNVHSTVKACSASKSNVPRNTRRGKRKSRSKRWSRRSSG